MKSSATYSSDFAEVARAYCSWCEAAHSEHSDLQAAYWLSRLYSQALLLPQVGSENDDGLPELPPEALAGAARNLAAAFAGRYYREIFDPDPSLVDEPVMGDIGDDLLDTYKDVRAGLVLFDRGETNEALWYWSFLHRIHWGRHAVGAMYALHCLAISNAE
jgi:hypothetical protein